MYVFRDCSVLDAWGKLPSAILQGNLFEFGGFSECFHIKRNGISYKTQYCMADLVFDFKGIAKPRFRQQKTDIFNMSDVWNDEFVINPRMAMPQ